MDSPRKVPTALIPITRFRIPRLIVDDEIWDVAGHQYPYWTEISILNLTQLNNENNGFIQRD